MRRWAALVLGLVTSTVVFAATAPPASAHAALLSTTPLDGEILQNSPPEVTLTYGEPVGTGLGALRVLSDQGSRVDTGRITQTAGNATVHLALQPDLSAGTYVVVWRVISADSHPVSGAFTFTVRTASRNAAQLLGRGNLRTLTAPPPGPGQALGVTRLLGFGALTVTLGALLFCLLLWPAGLPHVRRMLLCTCGLELVAAVFALLLQGPYAAGLPLSSTFHTTLAKEVLHTRYGEATATRIGLSVLAVLLVAVLARGGGRIRVGILTLVGLASAITWSEAGHGGVGTWQPWSLLFDASHLVAVSAWVGGLVVVVRGLRGTWTSEERDDLLPRWSRLAATSVAVLVATGVFAGVREVGEFGALTSTTYGRLLVVKSLLVGLMLLFALVGRSFVLLHYRREDATPPTGEDVGVVRRSVSIEAGIAGIVLAVTALLANTTPADAAFAPPYTGVSQAGPLSAHIDIYPARRGLNGLHVYTVGAKGLTVEVADVSGYAVRSDGEKITAHLTRKSLGHWEDVTFVLPDKGTWTITLEIRVDSFTSYQTSQTLKVR